MCEKVRGEGMSKLSMEPREMEAFRDATKKQPIIFRTGRQRVCQACKRNRSVTQFAEGKNVCKKCRGVR